MRVARACMRSMHPRCSPSNAIKLRQLCSPGEKSSRNTSSKELIKTKQHNTGNEDWSTSKIVLAAAGALVSRTWLSLCTSQYPGRIVNAYVLQVGASVAFMLLRVGSVYVRVLPAAATAAGPLFWVGASTAGFLLLRVRSRLSGKHALAAILAPIPLGIATIILQDANCSQVQLLRKKGKAVS